MNIKQNIVRIKTALQIGTGIIYPCEVNEDELGKTKFIIFTNKHLFKELDLGKDGIDDLIKIDIYDNQGNLINICKDTVSMKFFIPEDEHNKTEDIAVLLLTFNYKINLDLETKILWKDSNIDKIFVEGFPQILHDNDVSSKIQLDGKCKNSYPYNEKIGIFQILDDYHWYSNCKDLKLFQGFSGSPVYNREENSNFIVGMNQSILNIDNGENPFKLIYYYKFKFILEYLREKGCIIFNKNADNSISIRWIYEKNFNNTNEINLLLLGSSGAGKSSFAKTFLLHSNLIDSTNDGQTTRSNIIYELSLYNKDPKVSIKFLDKEQFVLNMIKLNYENYLLRIIKLIDEDNNSKFLKEYVQCLYIKNEIKNGKKKEEFEKNLLLISENSTIEQQNFIENLYDIVEDYIKEFIETKYNSFDEFIGVHYREVNDILSHVEGFFNINEFDDLKKINCEQKGIEEMTLPKYFDRFYENIHEQIIEVLKESGIISEKNYLYKISFHDTQNIKKWLPICLQVKDRKSLTGIIDYVYISDSISNDYSFILNDLNIEKMKIIDTYGLDHTDWEKEKGQVLSNILYNLQDKKLVKFNSDLAVTYIKKLDSGKPTELKTILPQIYNMIPQAPVYCIFNGLDIFLGEKIFDFQSLEDLNSIDIIPKSINYIISEDGKKDILNCFDKNDPFIENLYETLKNNITVFCSDDEKIEENYNIYENNKNAIYKLLLSITMKEHSSMNIISQKFIDELQSDKYDFYIEKITKAIFKNSSKTNWSSVHHRTRWANYSRVSGNRFLGYWGTYEHRWNQLFHRGYVNTIIQMEYNLLNVNKEYNYISAIDSCIKNMEEDFLGPSYQLVYSTLGTNHKEHKFRELMEKMYNEGTRDGTFKSNPFEKEEKTQGNNEIAYLDDVCNFEKGFKFIENEIIDHFKKCLIDTINSDNKAKSENLLKINYKFYSEFQKLKYEFNKKYSNVKFNELLKYYSEKNILF